MNPILTAKGITKSYRSPILLSVLKGIDLEVNEGESVAIVGRSGEGKSTLMQILGTLENPCSGKVIINGQDACKNRSQIRNQSIGYIYQSFHLLEDFTVLDNVLMPAKIARNSTRPGSAAYQRAEKLLHEVGLSKRKHHLAKQLSGGERQRVAIARALCNNPPILLADEPTGNLDSTTASAIHTLLLSLVKEHKKTLIVVTHDKNLAALCDKRLFLTQGHLHT
ncbi:MAG: ABC transporter ATP-binding protein [Waddliaceae bacterium]